MMPRAIVSGDPVPRSSSRRTSRRCVRGSNSAPSIERVRAGLEPSIAQSSGPDVEFSAIGPNRSAPNGVAVGRSAGPAAGGWNSGCTAAVGCGNGSAAGAAVLKSASGAYEHVPFSKVTNLARAMEELRGYGLLLVGLDSEADADIGGVSLSQPLALVLGAEGKGLRQLTRQTCDVVVKLDMPGAEIQ